MSKTMEEMEIDDLLDKSMEQMVKLTGCERDSGIHRALLVASILAILRAGGQVRWDGELREDAEVVLLKIYEELKESLTQLIRGILEWFNRHEPRTGKGPIGPPTPPVTMPESIGEGPRNEYRNVLRKRLKNYDEGSIPMVRR